MRLTDKLIHFHLGGGLTPQAGLLLGLPLYLDDSGAEFVLHEGRYIHVDEMPYEKRHTVTVEPFKVKRVPVISNSQTQAVINNPIPVSSDNPKFTL